MKQHLKNKCWSFVCLNGWYAFENICYTKGAEHKQTLDNNFTYVFSEEAVDYSFAVKLSLEVLQFSLSPAAKRNLENLWMKIFVSSNSGFKH